MNLNPTFLGLCVFSSRSTNKFLVPLALIEGNEVGSKAKLG